MTTPARPAVPPSVGEQCHELKTWPEQFAAVLSGAKRHEYRRDDRGFKVGDRLWLREFSPCSECGGSGRVWANGDKDDCDCTVSLNPRGVYTGNELWAVVTWITRAHEWGGTAGHVCLSISVNALAGEAK